MRMPYTFVVKTRSGTEIQTYEDEWLTEDEMNILAKGMMKGLQCRVKYPYIEVYSEMRHNKKELIKFFTPTGVKYPLKILEN